MHPKTFTARTGLLGVGHCHGDYFSHSTVHERYTLNLTSNMPDEDTFNLKIEFLDLEERKHSITDDSHPNFCFPPGYVPTTGPYAPHITDLTQQMAGMKRSQKDEDAYVPMAKRRVAPRGLSGKQDKSATPLKKDIARGGQGRTQKVVIDLSDDDEQPASNPTQLAEAIMKPLPSDSTTGDFPHFNSGAVYIIIDPENSLYQYRLHKTVLSRVSPIIDKALHLACPKEAKRKLKVANTDAEARFELAYSPKNGIWMLRRTPFTVRKQAGARMNATAVENVPRASDSRNNLNGTVIPPYLKPNTLIESGKPQDTIPTPGVLTSGIVASDIITIDVTKDGESNIRGESEKIISFDSEGKESPVEDQIQQGPTKQDEKANSFDDPVLVKPEYGGQADQVSVDQPLIKSDATMHTEKNQSTLLGMSSDHSVVSSKSGEDQTPNREEIDTTAIISSAGSEYSQVLRTLSEYDALNDQEETLLRVPPRIDLEDSILESTKFEDNSSKDAAEDNSSIINTSSTLDGVPSSAQTSSNQVVSQEDGNALSKPLPTTRPPKEICEAYNNLFLIFYNKPPLISKTSISVALDQCEAIISIAQRFQCLPAIRPYLAYAAGRFGKQLYMAVAAEPYRCLKISMILESAAIFKECMIHIVGSYIPGPGGQINLPGDIPQSVRDLIIFKVRLLDQQRMDVNERLFSSSIIIDSKIVTFSFVDTSIFSTWLVVQLWRDWFSRQMASVHLDPHKTGQLYRTLARAGDAYLTVAEVKAIIEKIREPVKVDPDELAEDLGLLKKFAQEAVMELCENNTMVDVQEAGADYLTCSYIMDEELPWFQTEK